jgi:hypothetical protein
MAIAAEVHRRKVADGGKWAASAHGARALNVRRVAPLLSAALSCCLICGCATWATPSRAEPPVDQRETPAEPAEGFTGLLQRILYSFFEGQQQVGR